LLKVLNYNDTTTSLVEVPCSAKQSGLRKPGGQDGFIEFCNVCIRKYKEKELVANDEQEDDDKFAYTDDDAARWLINYLGDCYPKDFVKSAQALDMPIHQWKMDTESTTAMWSDAGVGVAAKQIMMKYSIDCFGCKFTVAEALITQLAVRRAITQLAVRQASTVSLLFGKDWNVFQQGIVTLRGQVGPVETYSGTNAGS
jgi:hypothetical protein